MRAETIILQAGPRPLADADTLATLRDAIKAGRSCLFRYEGGSGPDYVRRVRPYGILFGKAYYLVGPEGRRAEPSLWRLDKMREVEVGDSAAAPPPGFDLGDYAARSFGVFQEEPADIVLRFAPEAAVDARRFLFHPSQSMEDGENGTLIVRFRSGGFLELARHLFTWGDAVEILAPDALRERMVAELAAALGRHRASS